MTFEVITLSEITQADITDSRVQSTQDRTFGLTAPPNSIGDIVADDNKLWIALEVDITTSPETKSGKWQYAGPADFLKPFDIQIGTDQERVTETVALGAGEGPDTEDRIGYTITAPSTITGLGFFGLKASSVEVTATLNAETVFDKTYVPRNVENYGGSLYRYLHIPPRSEDQIADFAVNIPIGSTIDILISRIGYVAEVAAICFGRTRRYGTAADNSSKDIISRSITENNGLTTTLVRRVPSTRTSFDLTLTMGAGEGLYRALEEIDGVAAVFGATDARPDLLTYGFHTSARRTYLMNETSRMTVEVEEL